MHNVRILLNPEISFTLEHSLRMHMIVLLATTVVVGANYQVDCDGIVFHGVYYDKEPIIVNINKPYNLFLHKFSGMLFFSHTINNGTHVDFSIATCHVDTKHCSEVSGIPGGYAIAYDHGNDDIYLGGHDGIYKYNFLTTTAEYFAEEGHSVWSMFVGKNFYYIRYPTQKLYVYRGDSFIQVAEAFYLEIDHFHVSKNKDLYYSNKTALYKVDYTHKHTTVLSDEISVKQIVEDNFGDIYFCAPGGIYIEDTPYPTIKKLARLDQAYGMTFDENEQVIYADHEGIYRLQPSKHDKECLQMLHQPLQEHELSEHHRFKKVKKTMALLQMLLTFVVAVNKIHSKTCHQIKFGETYYDRQMVWGISGRPFNLNVHRSTNVLYFSYSLLDGWADVDFHLAYVDIDTKDTQVIAGIRGGCAVAINQGADDIYLGGSEGIYRYNLLTKIADFYAEKNKNIWSLFHNHNLFYVSYPDQKLHIEVDGKFSRVKEFSGFEIDHFHVTRSGFIYFSNKTGLYNYEIAKMKVVLINDIITVRQIAEDIDGNLFVCTGKGIYTIVGENNNLTKVANIKNMHGITFDRDNNLIYSDEKSIILLRPGERC